MMKVKKMIIADEKDFYRICEKHYKEEDPMGNILIVYSNARCQSCWSGYGKNYLLKKKENFNLVQQDDLSEEEAALKNVSSLIKTVKKTLKDIP